MAEKAMAVSQLRVARTGKEEEEDFEPVSPTGQYFNSSVLSVGILAVFESEIPIDDSQTMALLKNEFLPINPRFSSIMVRDEDGVKRWKRVEIKLEDHVNVPVFPAGLSPEEYEEQLQEYLSKIAMEQLPQNRPLWEIHLIKYPTSNAGGTCVYKLHHALGDGFSLMGALLSCVKRADDPSLPLTFPSLSSSSATQLSGEENSIWTTICSGLSVVRYTVSDFAFSLLKSNWLEDGRTPVRSASAGLEFRPITISSLIFSLDHIQHVKTKLCCTVNDVICGIIFYGIQLYMHRVGKNTEDASTTALVLLNTRMINNYRSLKDMRADAENPWGNNFGFLHVPVPSCNDPEKANPLDFIFMAKKVIKQKRGSLAVYLTGKLLETLRKLSGPETTARYIHATLRNTSMTISNLVGPIEKMAMANHPVKSFYFMVVGVPQSLTITMMSYTGTLKLAVGAEKGFINSPVLISCLEKAFARIFEEAVGVGNMQYK